MINQNAKLESIQISGPVTAEFAEIVTPEAMNFVATPAPRTVMANKIGRNDPCPCGSGKKYKKCHGA